MKTLQGDFSPDRIQDVVAAHFCDVDMTVQGPRNLYRTCFEVIRLGQIEVLRYRSEGKQQGVRRWDHIRGDHGDAVSLYLPLSMEFLISTAEREAWLAPGQFAFIATNRPFSLVQEHREGTDFYSSVYVKIPGALIRQRLLCIDDLCCRAFPIQPGAGTIMRKVVEAALEDGPSLSEPAAAKFGQTLLDVVVAAAEWAADGQSPSALPPQAGRQRLAERAKAFIEENLSNPEISTGIIAAHCHVSVRYLHAAFAAAGETVAGYLRERRLELCRATLRDPLLRGRTITRIAADWGFTDASQFGRLYKSRFGRTPRQERASE